MSIRVVHLVQDLNVGGVERLIQAIITGLDPDRFSIKTIAVAGGGKIAEELRATGADIDVLSLKNCYDPRNILKLSRVLKAFNPDILHMHGYFAETLGRLSVFGRKRPVTIVHRHSIFHGLTFVNGMLDRFLTKHTRWQIMICEKVRQSFLDAGYAVGNSSIIYNGVDETRFAAGCTPHDKTVITVASLTEHKGHRFLIQAFASVAAGVPDTRLIVAGDGPLRDALKQQAGELGCLDKIEFTGIRGDIPELLAGASVFVLPSLREGLPVSIIEAMASGLPVIASRIGGVPELVQHGVSGCLVKPGASDEIAKVLERMLENPGEARAMGSEGRKIFLEKFTLKKMLAEMEALYARFAS